MAIEGVPLRAVPAVGVVCFRGDDVLLVRRGQPPKLGEWSIPGGRIEFGETAETAALRELHEETSIKARLGGLIDAVDAIFTSRRSGDVTRHYLLIDFVAEWISGEAVAGDDAAEARFFGPAELHALPLWAETRRVIEAGRKQIMP